MLRRRTAKMAQAGIAKGAAKKKVSSPDVVFIGAGINALAAAFLLARAGWRAVVVDRNKEPGGAVRTMELTLPGFRHDIGAMNLTVFANSPFFKRHRADLAARGVELITADCSFGSMLSDGRFL